MIPSSMARTRRTNVVCMDLCSIHHLGPLYFLLAPPIWGFSFFCAPSHASHQRSCQAGSTIHILPSEGHQPVLCASNAKISMHPNMQICSHKPATQSCQIPYERHTIQRVAHVSMHHQPACPCVQTTQPQHTECPPSKRGSSKGHSQRPR